MVSPLELSIIIPAFNEERRLPNALQRIHVYVETRPWRSEVIVVNDGSTDGTARIVTEALKQYPEVRLVSNDWNHGKGYSVRRGMLEAAGEIALFTDADLSAPIEEADRLIAALSEGGHDGAIGSRAVNRALIEVHQSRIRELAGIIFNGMVRLLTGLDFADTQCGFKAFRRSRARIIFEQQRIERFGFDPEILFLARRHGLSVVEVPVRWAHDRATKVHVFLDSIRMFFDLFLIRWNAWMGRYPR
jgi:dolichyl-phosphate beta-glucosyltransferase